MLDTEQVARIRVEVHGGVRAPGVYLIFSVLAPDVSDHPRPATTSVFPSVWCFLRMHEKSGCVCTRILSSVKMPS